MAWLDKAAGGFNSGMNRLSGLFGTDPIPEGGVMGEPQIQQLYNPKLAMATQLLAGSAPGSNFGEIMAKALMAGQQARQMQAQQIQSQRQAQIEEQLKQAQITNLLAPGASSKPNPDIEEYELAKKQGFQGSFFDYKKALAQASATNVKTEVNPAQYPNSFSEALGKADVETLSRYQKEAEGAAKLVGTLDNLQQLNQTAMAGGGAEARAQVANWVSGWTGADIVDPKKLADTQTYNAIVSKAILDSLGGSLGAGVSNADVGFIKATVPKLEYSQEARQSLINYMRARAAQSINLYDNARAYGEQNKGLRGFKPYEISGGAPPPKMLIPNSSGGYTYDPGKKR